MFHPSGHSPDEAGIEMSGHILSAGGRGGGLGSSSRQLHFKPQALSQPNAFLSFSPSLFLFAPPPPSSEYPQSYPVSAPLDSPLFPKASRRPIKCLFLDRRRMKYGARSQILLTSDDTLNLPFASFSLL